MKISTLRGIDRWLGLPACALLTLHRRAFGGRVPDTPVRRIAFVKLAEQGSTVLAEAAASTAIDLVGRDNVFFVVFEENRFVLDAMDLVPAENILTIGAGSAASAVHGTLSVVRRLRRLRIDAAVDLEFFARSSAIITYLSGATRRAGLHSFTGDGPWRGDLMTHRLAYNPYIHTADLFLLLVQALDHRPDGFPAFPVVPPHGDDEPDARHPHVPHEEDIAAMRCLVRELTGQREIPPLVLLNANCGDLLPLRRWEPSRYIDLARRLLDARPELFVAFTGAPGEAEEAALLVRGVSSRRAVSVAGHTTLPQLLALYSLSRVLVTNDSGPAHFATLTPIHVVTLFGPETPALFAARTPRNHVLWAGLACSPCVSAFNNRVSSCRNNLCMQQLAVDRVFDETLRAYDARETVPSAKFVASAHA